LRRYDERFGCRAAQHLAQSSARLSAVVAGDVKDCSIHEQDSPDLTIDRLIISVLNDS
jgi:hypothetical protein